MLGMQTTQPAAPETPALLAEWRALTATHARVSEALEHALHDRHGLSLTEFEVLQRLSESEHCKTRMQELADEVHLSQSALSRLVGRLEDAGLVQRAICDVDRRGIFACITDEGQAVRAKAEPTYRDALASTLRS
jgi:DNA-binding MarR family transcriptional regulator